MLRLDRIVVLCCVGMGLSGIAPAVAAAVAFGVQYVPVKKYKMLASVKSSRGTVRSSLDYSHVFKATITNSKQLLQCHG